jgi:hypothetical protein
VRKKVLGAAFGVVDLLRDWRYAVPLVLNLTGSVWFFLVVGKAGEFVFSWGKNGRGRGRGGERGILEDLMLISGGWQS